jgi:ribonuclease HI
MSGGSAAYRYLAGTLKHTKCYLLRFDGNTKPNPGISTSGLMLFSPFYKNQRIPLTECGVYHPGVIRDSTQSEYLALKSGLAMALERGVFNLVVEGDSSSVINAVVEGRGRTHKDLLEKIDELLPVFDTLAFRHIPRGENKDADRAAREAFYTQQSFENNLVAWSVEKPYGIGCSGIKKCEATKKDSEGEENKEAKRRKIV